MAEPSLEQWRELYAASAEFQQRAPWQVLANEDLFAVEDPDTGVLGFCSVMGMGGEEFGLAVFPGAEGLASYFGLLDEELSPESPATMLQLYSFALCYSDRKILDQRDLAVIRSLGLKFRGRNVWPWFRSYRPGYMPWYLEPGEATLLTHALRQSIAVADDQAAGRLTVSTPLAPESVLTRYRRRNQWTHEWRRPPTLSGPEEPEEPLDMQRMGKLRGTTMQRRGTWLLDFRLIPTPIEQPGDRPYYPVMLLIVNEQGLVLATEMLHPSAPPAERCDAVIATLERLPVWPQTIVVETESLRRLVAPVGSAIGVRTIVGDISHLDAVLDDLFEYLEVR